MKQIIALVVLLVVVGIAGFVYRNALERPQDVPQPVACTMEAKVCPDGSSVGRQGPECAFATCALPNAEDAAIGIAFVIPSGYVANPEAIGPDETLRAVFDKKAQGEVPHTIMIRRYPIEAGKTGEQVMIEQTMFSPSGINAKSTTEFKSAIINGKTYRTVVIERFEAQVHTAYYLIRASDVLKFEVIERDVTEWMNPTLVVDTLPEHQAFQKLLTTLQAAE